MTAAAKAALPATVEATRRSVCAADASVKEKYEKVLP